jgi:hypothetical protein
LERGTIILQSFALTATDSSPPNGQMLFCGGGSANHGKLFVHENKYHWKQSGKMSQLSRIFMTQK